jgi:hypothetical protein
MLCIIPGIRYKFDGCAVGKSISLLIQISHYSLGIITKDSLFTFLEHSPQLLIHHETPRCDH